MKKLIALLALTLTVAGCSSSSTPTSSESSDEEKELNAEIVEYFDKYDDVSSMGNGEGYVYCFDDGTEYGLALVVKFTEEQAQEYNDAIDDFDTFFDKIETIVEESDTYEVIDLNEEVPAEDAFDKYVGETIGTMMDDGFEQWGYMLDKNQATFNLMDSLYSVDVVVDQAIDEGDLSDNYTRGLTISSVAFTGFSDEFFNHFIEE